MKKIICFVLCVVLTFGLASQAVASDTLTAEPVSAESSVRPVAYTTDFDGYDNVVGVLNSDGTKTAYLFASKEDAKQVDSITGLVSPSVTEQDVAAEKYCSRN